jgi:hypothetical protein
MARKLNAFKILKARNEGRSIDRLYDVCVIREYVIAGPSSNKRQRDTDASVGIVVSTFD